jgi:CRP/FNR family transcriptional regulator, cyclic AMP receptor protein
MLLVDGNCVLSYGTVHSVRQSMGTQPKTVKKRKDRGSFDPQAFLATVGSARTVTQCQKGHKIFSQGDPSDAVFYIQRGRVILTVKSKRGKEAVIAIRGPQCFFGDGCIAGQTVRVSTATAIAPSSILRIEKSELLRVLHEEPALSDLFILYQVSRNIGIEEALVDQLFNSSEKRLARVLLMLAHYGKEGKSEDVLPDVSQELLAKMVGTTRSRISFFMNKFRKLGFIDYSGDLHSGLRGHTSLQHMVLHD